MEIKFITSLGRKYDNESLNVDR